MRNSLFIKFVCAALLAGVVISCKKNNNLPGAEVQPENDVLNASFDNSTPVYMYTQKVDSIISFNSNLKFLGFNNDPVFGKTQVGLYLNANMSVSNLTFSPNSVIDSAEIILAVDITNSMGDVNSTLTYSVFTIDSTLNSSRDYYTNNTKLHSQANLIKTSSSTYTVLGGTQVIRIPVDTAFAKTILNDAASLVSNETFQAKYKGFYIQCASQQGGEGVIYHCLLNHELSGFYLKYHLTTEAGNKNFRFTFDGSTAAGFNTVKYDYSSAVASLKNQLNGDTNAGAQNLFLKGMGRTRVKVLMPALNRFADSFKVAINRAELVVNVDPSFEPGTGRNYLYPQELSLLAIDSLGEEIFVTDQANTTYFSRYGGTYDQTDKRYVFNIARHVQAIVNGQKKNYGFYLVVTDPNPLYTAFKDRHIERVVLYGSSHAALKPTFNLSYIKFPKD